MIGNAPEGHVGVDPESVRAGGASGGGGRETSEDDGRCSSGGGVLLSLVLMVWGGTSSICVGPDPPEGPQTSALIGCLLIRN